MLDVTKDSSTSKFLASSSKFPGIQKEGVKTQNSLSVSVLLIQQGKEETEPGGSSQALTKAGAAQLLRGKEPVESTYTPTQRGLLTTGAKCPFALKPQS